MHRGFCLGLLLLVLGTSCHRKIDSQKIALLATVRISLGTGNIEGNGPVGNPAVPTAIDKADISDNGRFIAFTSSASNLVPNDNNAQSDVFLWDNVNRTCTLVSSNLAGTGTANGSSFSPSISGDGRYVAFVSTAIDIHPDKSDAIQDIIVRDMSAGGQVFLASRASGPLGVKSNGGSSGPRLSKNGRYVVFTSRATNLDPADTDTQLDVYRRDFNDPTGTTYATILISRATGAGGAKGTGGLGSGSQNPDICRDGHLIVFESDNSNLVTTSGEGGPIAAPFTSNVFLRDANANTTIRLSVANVGVSLDPDAASAHVSISGDGNFVTFQSRASNIVAKTDNNPDIYWRDVRTPASSTGSTIISVHTSGVRAGSGCDFPVISEDGTLIVWDSPSTSLVDNDTNGVRDCFLHDRSSGITSRVSVTTFGEQLNAQSLKPMISADSRYIVFYTEASNAGDQDNNGTSDFYMRGPPF
jgi:Tol biopolymer transport system component